MKTRIALIVVALVLVCFPEDSGALPACGQRVMCGTICTYTELGGQCSGGGNPDGSYCYRETVKNDYDTVVFSCFDGAFDSCCVPDSAF